jgi:hypothetical protein
MRQPVAPSLMRGLQRGQPLEGRLRPWRLVHRGPAPAEFGGADRHRDQVRLDLPRGVGGGDLPLAAQGVGVGALLADGGKPVVQVLRGHPHEERRLIDDLL